MDGKKIGVMLKDIIAMKELLAPGEEDDPEMQKELKNLDKFHGKKHELNVLLKDLRADVERLVALRKGKDANNRDGNMIKLTHGNTNALAKAGSLFGELLRVLNDDIKKKGNKLGEKTIDDRRKQTELLGEEIKHLVTLNSYHKGGAATIPTNDGGRHARSRSEKTREDREKAKRSKRHNKRGKGGGGDGGGGGGPSADAIGGALDQATAPSEQEQEFLDQVDANFAEQDEILDDIGKAMDELHALSKDMKKDLEIQGDLIEVVSDRVTKTTLNLKSTNQKLKSMLEESGGVTRFCPIMCMLILLISLIGYLFM